MTWRWMLLPAVFLMLACSKGAPKPPAGPIRVDEVVASPEKLLAAAQIKVHGYVVPGSINARVVEPYVVRTFQIEEKNATINVRHKGPTSDLFRDHAEVVITGKLIREGGGLLLVTIDGEDGILTVPQRYP